MIEIDGKMYSPDEIAVLSKAGMLHTGQKNDPSGSLNAVPLQGPFPGPSSTQFGIFSDGTVEPGRFSAMPRTRTFLSVLGAPRRSEVLDSFYEILTGQTADGTANAADFCGDAPEAGNLKTCKQKYIWGSFFGKTRLNMIPAMGMLKNRTEVPAQILNVAPAQRNPFVPDAMYALTDPRSQLRNELYTMGIAMERSTEVVSNQGQAGVDNSRYGWFKEFAGTDSLVKTGHTDFDNGSVCPAADSWIESFNANIGTTDALGRTIVEALSDHYFTVTERAASVGMADTQFVIKMHPKLWRGLVEVWACNYASYRCDGSQGNPVNREGTDVNRWRTEMMRGKYLLIEGVPVPVVFSDGMAIDRASATEYVSDIEIIPISWAGQRLTYLEYFPMDNPYAMEFVNFQGDGEFKTLNNGMFFVANRNNGNCREYLFSAMMRLILRTPFLAARLDDVRVNDFTGIRGNDPAVTYYYDNGGVTYR